jgi:hypothetical protein
MKVVLLWLVRSLSHRAGTRDFCVGCSSRPRTQYFFLTVQYFSLLSPSPSKLGRQLCRVASLFLCVLCIQCVAGKWGVGLCWRPFTTGLSQSVWDQIHILQNCLPTLKQKLCGAGAERNIFAPQHWTKHIRNIVLHPYNIHI